MSTYPGEESPTEVANSWAAIYALSLLAFAMVTAELLPSAMLPLMAEGLHTSEGMIGQSVTAAAVMAITFSLTVGTLAQGRDRRWLLIAFTGVLLMSNVVVAVSPNVWTMLIARAALGATIGVNWGLMPSITLRLAPDGHVARSLSLIVGGSAVSGVVAAPTAALLGDLFGWRSVFAGSALIAGLALVALLIVLPSIPAEPHTQSVRIGATLALPGLKLGMVAIMLMFGGSQLYLIYQVPFLEDVSGLPAGAVSLVLLFTGITGLIGTLSAAKPLEISINGTFTAISAMLAIVLALLLLFGHLLAPAVILAGIYTAGRSMLAVGGNAWIARSYAGNAEGAGGVLVASIHSSFMISAMLGGVLIDTVGAKGPPFAAMVILTVAAMYVHTVLPRRIAPQTVVETV